MLLGIARQVGNAGDPALVIDAVCAASKNTCQRAQIAHEIMNRLRAIFLNLPDECGDGGQGKDDRRGDEIACPGPAASIAPEGCPIANTSSRLS